MEPELRFATDKRGKRIAYTIVGSGPPLVCVPGWVSHQGQAWATPPQAGPGTFYRRLAEHHTVVTYDKVGTGLSDREREEFTLDAEVDDLKAVIDHARLRRPAVLGISEGGPCAIAYTARYPRQVSKLALYATYAYGPGVARPEQQAAFVTLVRGSWGLGSRAMADMFMPDASGEALEQFAHMQRANATAEVAAKLIEYVYSVDVTGLLSRIRMPTLVVHGTSDRAISFRLGRELAAGLPNARLVPLEGMPHVSADSFKAFGDALLAFLAEETLVPETVRTPTAEPAAKAAVQTILVTDIAEHTSMLQRLGDARGREVLREHERRTREAFRAHGGSEFKAMGDGFLASFSSAQKALECAMTLQRSFAESDCAGEPLRLRIGINAGEPIPEDDDLFGSSVILAARASQKAEGGQVYVTNVVRELVAGKGLLFADVGEFVLRGFEDPVRLFELKWD